MTNSILNGVDYTQIPYVWNNIIHLLRPAIKRARGRFTEESIFESLKHREMQCWISTVDNEIEAVCITQILTYPGIKVLSLPIVGGKNRHNWLCFQDTFEQFAIANGCQELEGYARTGWLGLSRKSDKDSIKDWDISNVNIYKIINNNKQVRGE